MPNDFSPAQYHQHALVLLGQPECAPDTLALLKELAAHAHLLWQATPDSALSIDAFCDARARLAEVTPEPGLARIIGVLGHGWRALPLPVLLEMARAYMSAPEPLMAELEIRHIGAWVAAIAPPSADLVGDLAALRQRADAWQVNTELILRQHLLTWEPAAGGLTHAGFLLEPIVSTRQLVASAPHQDILRDLALRDACAAGRAACFFVQPQWAQPDQGPALVGLHRADALLDWETWNAYAPPANQAVVEALARNLLNQANAVLRAQRLRDLAGPSLAVPDAQHLIGALLHALDHERVL